MAERPIFLVRHGAYGPLGTFDKERLTSIGCEQSKAAAGDLSIRGVDQSGVVISSDAPRALETARIIAEEIGIEQSHVFPNRYVYNAGHYPRALRSMVGLVELMLQQHGIEPEFSEKLTIVTHLPLIAALTGLRNEQVANGSVHEVNINDFQALSFSPSLEREYLPEMANSQR